jgi:hypothetical protein
MELVKKYGSFDVKYKCVKGYGNKIKVKDIESNKNYGIDTYTEKDGILLKEVNEEHPDKDKNKIIFANKTRLKYSYIDYGKYNLTGCDKFYIIKNNKNKLILIQKYFTFKLINLLVLNIKYRQQFIEKDVFDYIPNILNMTDNYDISETEFYKLCNFTNEELEEINKF